MSTTKYFSDWMRVDLHIHTDKSKETKNNDYWGTFSTTTLKEKLKENNVSIFSLTDHNIINVDAYNEYVESYNSDLDDPFPMLGFEADIVVEISGNRRTYHALVIFAEDITKNKSAINTISQKLETVYQHITDKKQRHLDFEQLIDAFDTDEFLLIVHSGSHKSIVEAYRGNVESAQKKVLVLENMGVEQGNAEKKRIFNNGFQKYLENYLHAENYVPYLDFSDNHNIEQYPCKHSGTDKGIHEFYYIKGIKNYESLRLAFIDPVARIKSETELDTIRRSLTERTTLKELRIENTYLEGDKKTTISETSLKFSPHLNVIIGGRSSGKSLLIDILGRKFTGLTSRDLAGNYTYDTNKHKIKSDKDDDFINQANVSNSSLIYITQHKIVNYFMNNDLKDLADKSNKGAEYDDSIRQFNTAQRSIKDLADSLSAIYSRLEPLQNSQYTIHQVDIDSIKLDGWCFKPININRISKDFDSIEQTLSNLKQETTSFKDSSLIRFTSDEFDTINAFQQLLEAKHSLIKKEKEHIAARNNFLEAVETIRTASNAGIDLNAQRKQQAKQAIDSIAESAKNAFAEFYVLKQICKQVETKKLFFETSLEIDNGIKLTRETLGINKESTMDDIILEDVFLNARLKLYPTMIMFPPIKHGLTFAQKLSNALKNTYDIYASPKDSLVYSDGSSSKSNSPGLNSEQYLKTILSNKNVQIIVIDQPEDNLGNTFISGQPDSLVDLIRKEKLNKQIFLSTHNASIVVFGDAECIILSVNQDNTIKYSQILMEDPENAKKIICENLDGGYEVFDNRSRKYNIKKIIKQ